LEYKGNGNSVDIGVIAEMKVKNKYKHISCFSMASYV